MPWNRNPSYQAITLLRRHSRECRGLETREYLVAVERRMVELIDLERREARDGSALPIRLAAE
ncbi:hypothetical protein ABAZ39_22485 (plasmid) [Azospirillum argentinense]|uniref:Uncharacterized protein n=1 Tax=Azospirillum argentinense TaxID=2970906 RepID=A0A060DUP8_9PROT|nr:hypothetical protein [Azospirillum argentinense]AIB14669.1 hypothetical protein ABAZ39_22485 [Azospirillum argentinense]EZQ06417.1 hypothetical protein ABAZ39_15670 [Azospirillum argentinense]KAA1055965.1 hypothetical protein FH063_004940 [Azospirillum argentinense]MBK3801077.1 hypothetical protein [Azospirillum argentinense]PNQ99292.1 hypothetical protein C1S70_08940 [Azospirillum argentinense]